MAEIIKAAENITMYITELKDPKKTSKERALLITLMKEEEEKATTI